MVMSMSSLESPLAADPVNLNWRGECIDLDYYSSYSYVLY